MAYLYSLYDALVSINVPSDKARAVVDAMERDMGATLATRQDLELHRLATKRDLELVRAELKQVIAAIRAELKEEIAAVGADLKQEIAAVRAELGQTIDKRYMLLDQRIDTLELRLTVKFGSMLFLGLGLTIAVLRLWS